MQVNCSERKKPPITSSAMISTTGVPGTNSAHAPSRIELMAPFHISVGRNPKRLRI